MVGGALEAVGTLVALEVVRVTTVSRVAVGVAAGTEAAAMEGEGRWAGKVLVVASHG